MSHGYITHTDGKDPLVQLIGTAGKDFYEATRPGKWFVDIFPLCKCLSSSTLFFYFSDSFVIISKIYPLLVPGRWVQENSCAISEGEHGSNRSSVSIRDQGNGLFFIFIF